MIKNIKVVTCIVATMMLFSALLVVSSALSFNAINRDKENFTHANLLTRQQGQLSDSWQALLKTRITITRVAIRFLKKQSDPASLAAINTLLGNAKETLDSSQASFNNYKNTPHQAGQDTGLATDIASHYQQYYTTLQMSINYLSAGNYAAYGNLDAQKAQSDLEKSYHLWRDQNRQLLQGGMDENLSGYRAMVWALSIVLLALLLLMVSIGWLIRQILLTPLKQLLIHIQHIADGELSATLTLQGHSEMGQLASHLKAMQRSLINTVGNVRSSTQAIYQGAGEISNGNNNLSARTGQQAASLEQTAASMEELTATVKRNTENARQASQLAKSASDTAEEGGQVVDGVVHTMTEIATSSRKIADITSVIDGIAFQTNILALNAAVEAARAGEQGRGFAVVAGEVRNLAQRSAQAAKEIKALIEESVNRVDTGSQQVTHAGQTMQNIVTAVVRVTDIMGEIASASDEQSRGIDQVAQAVTEMDRVTQQNASLVQESAAASASLEEQAGLLAQAVAIFRIDRHPVSTVTVARPQPLPLPASAPRQAVAKDEGNWETF